MSDGHPCLIREVLYAPPAEEEVVALVEVALNFHNSAHYHQAVQTYIQARELWAREERKLPAEANIFFHLSIGLVYQSEGEDDLAFAEFMEALRYEYDLEEDHPDRALIYSCIAAVHFHRGGYQEALDNFEKAHILREDSLGPEHVDTALMLHNIGACHMCLGNQTFAVELFCKSLQLFKAQLGSYHPRCLAVSRNLNKAKSMMLRDFVPDYVPPAPMLQLVPAKKKTGKKGKKKGKKARKRR